MGTIKLNYQDVIITDPCYIKRVSDRSGTLRFDALKLIEVIHDGGDGEFPVETPDGTRYLGVDSGRIWKLQTEFRCDVEIDSGLSGHIILRNDGTQ